MQRPATKSEKKQTPKRRASKGQPAAIGRPWERVSLATDWDRHCTSASRLTRWIALCARAEPVPLGYGGTSPPGNVRLTGRDRVTVCDIISPRFTPVCSVPGRQRRSLSRASSSSLSSSVAGHRSLHGAVAIRYEIPDCAVVHDTTWATTTSSVRPHALAVCWQPRVSEGSIQFLVVRGTASSEWRFVFVPVTQPWRNGKNSVTA